MLRTPITLSVGSHTSFAHYAATLLVCALAGCGTTRMTDTMRTGTEQLLLSNAIDRSISEINFSPLTGKSVYLDSTYLRGIIDEGYIISSLRQALLSSGCLLKANREEAMYILEARAGAVGTNRHDVLVGIPSVSLPTAGLISGAPSMIPEIPFAKSSEQKGIAKLAMFAYNQQTGQPIWQSGAFPIMANAKDTWVLGTGPFQRGSIYDGTRFAGARIMMPFAKNKPEEPRPVYNIPVTAEAVYQERPMMAGQMPPLMAQKGSATSPPAPPAWQPTPSINNPFPNANTQVRPQQPQTGPATISGGNGATGILYLQQPWIRDQLK